ncbi:hypothetical protein ACZ90_61125 [Streptomyces albus subsp. albus]|nr:hypothetical protein ACZ90_61125 [Streptomyces albus subsp. albus]
MNSPQSSAARVGVCVSGTRDDAYRVFEVLKATFPATEETAAHRPDATPPDPSLGHMVWSLVVDTTGRVGTVLRPTLDEAVSVDLYGTDPELGWVRDVLEGAFGIAGEQHVSGEHEMELRLRLAA